MISQEILVHGNVMLFVKHLHTCTVAFGSQARGIKHLSLVLRRVPHTARKDTIIRANEPITITAVLKPEIKKG